MAVALITSAVALILTVITFSIYDYVSTRKVLAGNLKLTAAIIADASSAAVRFGTDQQAQDTLAFLHSEPHIVRAALYNDKGMIFVRYPPNLPITDFPLVPGPPGLKNLPKSISYTTPVVEKESVVGTLYLESDLGAINARMRLYSGIAVLILLGAIVIAVLISNTLQTRITEPILALANVAKTVSEKGDYSVRAPRLTRDELGFLTDAFNQMLRRIQEQTQALRESDDRLRLALESSGVGAWEWNARTNEFFWEQHLYALFGVKPGEVKPRFEYFLERIAPEDRARVQALFEMARAETQELMAEFAILWPDGTKHFLITRGKSFPTERGEPNQVTGVILDVTERKRAQEDQALLASIVQSSDDAIIGKDLSGVIVSWNRGAEKIFGYSAAEVVSKPVDIIIAPERPDEEAQVLEAIRAGMIRRFETVRRHKDGRLIPVSLTASPIRNAAGDIIGMSTIARDISEQKRAQEALEQHAAVLREQTQMLDMANLLARDLNDRIILWNSGMEKIYGWNKSEALGKSYKDLLRTRSATSLAEIRQHLDQAGVWEGELVHTAKDGREVIVTSEWVLYRDGRGNPSAILEVNNDITARREAEEQVRQMNAELEHRVQERTAELRQANQELEAFTYSVAHDLRAPLRHLEAFSRILHEDFGGSLPPDAIRYLDNIRNGSRHMSQLVDDLLNLARVGRQELRRLPTRLNDLVDQVVRDMGREAPGRSIEWRIAALPQVDCDPGLMRQVFANLLSNAVKYTRPREKAVIEIGANKINGEVSVFVRDNGVGFNMKYASKLFGVFQRLHRAEEFEGTGIGLATVDRIVRKHGGTVWAESRQGESTTFYFKIPMQAVPAAA